MNNLLEKGDESSYENEVVAEEKSRWNMDNVMSFVISQEKVPFAKKDEIGMEIFGSILMWAMILVANMGGLSGAGTNIPIMLICYNMNMKQAVPLSAAVAVCATVFRFVLNFKQKHPADKARVAINYEVVEITMPFVFLGSFIGVKLGQFFDEYVRVIVFGVTVAWSIQTTTKKAMSLVQKEKEAAQKESLLAQESQPTVTDETAATAPNDSKSDKEEDEY